MSVVQQGVAEVPDDEPAEPAPISYEQRPIEAVADTHVLNFLRRVGPFVLHPEDLGGDEITGRKLDDQKR